MDDKLFYSRGSYTRIEKGYIELNINKLAAICAALGWEARINFYEFSNPL
jgi:uncharacterized membrane protein